MNAIDSLKNKTCFRIFLFIWFAIVIAGHGQIEAAPFYQNVAPGLDYANVRETNHPWSIHIARLDRARSDLRLMSTLSQGKVVGLSSLRAQIEALPAETGKPLAGVNGDFFVIAKGPYQGDPLGLQILNGELVSAPAGASFWTDPEGKIFLDDVKPRFQVKFSGDNKIPFGLNQERTQQLAVLYTPTFGSSTQTTNGCELILEKVEGKSWLPLKVEQNYSAKIREIKVGGNSMIEAGTMVLSVDPKMTNRISDLKPGMVIRLATGTSKNISGAVTALGGRPLLVVHGKEQQWPVNTGTNAPLPRHPRTAVGWDKKYFYMVVVDGRQKELSMGMNYPELARFMKLLGCEEAMNLDGGGSTTFWLKGKVMNSPSDKRERSLANALVIVQSPSFVRKPVNQEPKAH